MTREFPCQRVASPSLTRRDMLRRTSLGFGSLALASLLRDDALLRASDRLAPLSPGTGKVRSVVFFFLGGGPSQVDTFDPKPLLAKLDG